MPITPVEIRHLHFRRGLVGYRRTTIDRALTEIADSFEQVWRQRADLSDRIEELEKEVNRHVELEALLRQTLVSAERAAQDMKDGARREADVILTEAQAKARTIMRDAISDKERVIRDARRVQAMLRTALEVVEESAEAREGDSQPSDGDAADAAPPATEPGMRRLAG